MTCGECRELMLEADARELRGDGASPLAEHLRMCDECRVFAARVVAQQDELSTAFSGLTSRRTAAEMAGIARRESATVIDIRSGRRAPRLRTWGLISVAAAAAIVVTVVNRKSANDLPKMVAPDSTAQVSFTPAPDLDVEVPEGRNAIIMNTGNPKISVIWIY